MPDVHFLKESNYCPNTIWALSRIYPSSQISDAITLIRKFPDTFLVYDHKAEKVYVCNEKIISKPSSLFYVLLLDGGDFLELYFITFVITL